MLVYRFPVSVMVVHVISCSKQSGRGKVYHSFDQDLLAGEGLIFLAVIS